MTHEDKSAVPKTPFDNLTSPSHLDVMKLLLPYTAPSRQKMFALLIKVQELEHTVQYFENFPMKMQESTLDASPFSLDFIRMLKPYLSSSTSDMFDNFESMMSMMELFRTMSSNADTNEESGFSPTDLMMGFLSPEQQEMMSSFQSTINPDNNYEFENEGETAHEQQLDEQSPNQEYGSDEVRTN